MIVFDPGVGEPMQWVVCFSRRAATAWLARLPIGTFKHVRAFGYVAPVNTWIFFDPALDRTAIKLARGAPARAMIGEYLRDAEAVVMRAASRETLRPRLCGWCVPAVKHLVGIRSGALRPDSLLRDCLRHGGQPVDGRTELQPAAA